jgi:hypothetical protein
LLDAFFRCFAEDDDDDGTDADRWCGISTGPESAMTALLFHLSSSTSAMTDDEEEEEQEEDPTARRFRGRVGSLYFRGRGTGASDAIRVELDDDDDDDEATLPGVRFFFRFSSCPAPAESTTPPSNFITPSLEF